MFRTRDFLVIIGAVVFLLLAIGATLVARNAGFSAETETLVLVEVPDEAIYTAEIAESEGFFSREERVLDMRQKIASGGALSISAPELAVEEVVEVLSETEENQDDVVHNETLLQCTGYTPYNNYWMADGVTVEIVEGSRVFYRTIEQDIVTLPNAEVTPDAYRVAVLQLPIQSFLTIAPNCLTSDVVGIAHDGSLIRNSEGGLYGVFGEGTMIGYALDGHPIYGVSEAALDTCGGRMEGGEYRYYLSDERETILNCFVSVPAAL